MTDDEERWRRSEKRQQRMEVALWVLVLAWILGC